ncbi:Zinc finger HIT-type [Trinorchestia longiramus]|nr:Zinc finger HIT-type [Trinorchestia longiramus]
MSTENCKICRNNAAKYKCPSCLLKYCSVPCYKTHKSSSSDEAVRCSSVAHTTQTATETTDSKTSLVSVTPDEEITTTASPAAPVNVNKLLLPTQDTVPQNVLHELQHSSELRSLLQSPALRSQLQELSSCTSGPEAAPLLDGWLRENRDFRRFADACLSVVAPERNTYREDWTGDDDVG